VKHRFSNQVSLGRATAVKTFTRNNNLSVEERNDRQARTLSVATNRGCVASLKAPLALAFTLVLTTLVLTALLFSAASASAALPPSFATEGSGAGQISGEPGGIATDAESGDVYVADRSNNRVEKFGPEGEFLLAWGFGVADGASEEAQVCTTVCFQGLPGAGSGQFEGAEGIAVNNDGFSSSHGDVYVVDSANHRIEKFGPEGKFVLMLGGQVNATTKGNVCLAGEACQAGVEGTGPGEFSALTDHAVAVDSEGTLYVADEGRVQLFDEAGTVTGEILLSGGVERIENLAVDSAKDIYVQSNSLSGVHKYNSIGTELGKPRDEAGFAHGLALTIGPGNELFVNDLQENHHILGYDPEGKQLTSFDAAPQEPLVRGIAYNAHTQALYVLNQSGTVRIVPPLPPGPHVFAETASEVQATTAKLEATVNPEGGEATKYHFDYGTTAAYGESTPVSAPLEAVNEVQSVTVSAGGGGFTLSFKGEASAEIPFNATAGEVQAALEAIPTLGAGQLAVSGEPGAWSVEFTGARGDQNVPELSADPGGLTGSEPSAVVATTTPGISLFDDRAASAALTGLTPGTEYHFRVVAENAAKEVTFGPDQTFVTLPPVSIDSVSASQVNATSARLEAELNPHGVASEYHFEYLTEAEFAANGNSFSGSHKPALAPSPPREGSVGSGTADSTVTNLIQGLLPATTYHYRVVAHNELGAVAGPDRSFTTQGASSQLPDGRSWELVTPPNKHGAPVEPIPEEGGLVQAAAGGGAFAEVAHGPLGPESEGVRSPTNNQWLSERGAGGWATKDITTPHEEISTVHAGFSSEYKFFNEDLRASIVEPEGATRLDPGDPANTERTPYQREADGDFVPLVTAANVPSGTKFGGVETKPGPEPGGGLWEEGVEFLTASPDGSHMVLTSPQVLTPGFKAGFESVRSNLYELAGGQLKLVSVLPGPAAEPTSEAGLKATAGKNNLNMRGAISSDGTRVAFETEGVTHDVYVRDTTLNQTVQVDVPQQGATGGPGEATFQAASSDGAKVFFEDASRLTRDSTAQPSEPDLYMCEVAVVEGRLTCTLTDLTVDHNLGEAANLNGGVGLGTVSAIDASGERVYFAANGVLTSTPNGQGQHAVPGDCNSEGEASCNLYVYDTDTKQVALVAVLSSHDDPDWAGRTNEAVLGNLTARSSPDGHYFTFMSRRSLTGYDNRDVRSGEADAEVYLYDAQSGALHCISCDPTGARPEGVLDPAREVSPGLLVDYPRSWRDRWLAGSIPGWTLGPSQAIALYQSRYLSDSGRTFFNAADSLVPQDTNKREDVYEFELPGTGDCTSSSATFSSSSGGCVSLISSGTSEEESAFLDASENGDEVFFLTSSRLVGTDVDAAMDVYDAHVCSSSSPCPPPPPPPAPPCEGDACQNPSTPPADQTPGSLSFHGPGNLTQPAAVKAKAKPLTRAQQLAKALKTCRVKQNKRKRASCEKQARKKYGPLQKTNGKVKK
jgi:DNA-binding beta-propeller fold protein YncE